MAAPPRSSRKDLLRQYHRIAHDVLLGDERTPKSSDEALLSAAESGQEDRVFSLLEHTNLVSVNCHDKVTGDTPLITAARNGHSKVIAQLLDAGADITVQNKSGETALDVTMGTCRDMILDSLAAENQAMKNQTLLQAAWSGDAVTVKKCLDGHSYIDVNCRNGDGMTPLLLATRDISLFEQIQDHMSVSYDPVQVVKELLEKQADAMATDSEGHSPLHLVTGSNSVHAQRMITLLVQHCDVDVVDKQLCTPLHLASSHGYSKLIVALLDSGANVDCTGGENMDTPVIITSRAGHHEATEVLLERNANVTVVAENGDTALSIAKSPHLRHMMKEAWNGQTRSSQSKESVDSLDVSSESQDPPLDHIGSPEPRVQSHDAESPDAVHSTVTRDKSCFITQERNNSLTSPSADQPASIDGCHDNGQVIPAIPHNLFGPDCHGDEVTDYGNQKPKAHTPTREIPTSVRRGALDRTVGSDVIKSRGESLGQQGQSPVNKGRPKLTIPVAKEMAAKKGVDKGGSLFYRSQSGSHLHERHHSDLARLPVVKSCSAIPQKPHKGAHVPQLPSILNHCQPVSMVAVEMDRETVRTKQWHGGGRVRSNSLLTTTRQATNHKKSLNLQFNKRHSTGSIPAKGLPMVTKEQLYSNAHHGKVSFLPSVVTPQLTADHSPVGGGSHGNHKGRLRSLQPTGGQTTPPPAITILGSPLSTLLETTEHSNHSTLTTSPGDVDGSKRLSGRGCVGGRTRRDSEEEHFSDDSLDGKGKMDHLISPRPHRIPVHHMIKEAGEALSPIWRLNNQLPSDEVDDSSSGNSEYVTSYIGRQTPQPHMHPPESPTSVRRVGDSGQGESDSEHDTSSDVESDVLANENIRWKRGRLIGKGAFGKVWEGLMESAKLIAVKEVELDMENDDKAKQQYIKLQLEVDILRSLDHRNIVSYLGTSMEHGAVYIFMEYIAGGSIQSLVRRFGAQNDRQIQHYTKQVLRGLNYLHFNGIIHRDIKGANIMVTHKGVVKLIDFGCAKRYYEHVGASNMFHSVRGTPYWMAPEVICGSGYGRRSDIWSTGCTIHEMATTRPPWGDLPPEAAMFQIGIGGTVPSLPDHVTPPLRKFYLKCLTRDPSQRPTAHDLLQTDYMKRPP